MFVLIYFIWDRLIFFTPGGQLEKSASYFVYPVLALQRSVVAPLKKYFDTKRTVQELTAQLYKMQAERDCALAHNVELSAMVDYNQSIIELVDFKKKYLTENAYIAQVIAKHFSDQNHYFLVDAGENKGIRPDMIAVHHNFIVGRVVEVYPWYCKILLISDKNCKIAARCSTTKATGIFEGCNEYHIGKLNHVSHLSKLAYEDILLSSGEGLIFPKGLGIGKIKSYQINGLFYDVTIEPLLDLKNISYCALIGRDDIDTASLS